MQIEFINDDKFIFINVITFSFIRQNINRNSASVTIDERFIFLNIIFK